MPDNLLRTRHNLQIVLQALAAAAPYSTNAESEYLTWKRFIDAHPNQQVFELTQRENKERRHRA